MTGDLMEAIAGCRTSVKLPMYILMDWRHRNMDLILLCFYLCTVCLSACREELIERSPVFALSPQGEQWEDWVVLHLQEVGTEGGVKTLCGWCGIWQVAQRNEIISFHWFSWTYLFHTFLCVSMNYVQLIIFWGYNRGHNTNPTRYMYVQHNYVSTSIQVYLYQ